MCSRLGQCVEKPRGYHGDWSPQGSPKAKTRRAAGLLGFRPRDFLFTMIHPKLFHTFLFFCHPGLVKSNFVQPMDSLETTMVNA